VISVCILNSEKFSVKIGILRSKSNLNTNQFSGYTQTYDSSSADLTILKACVDHPDWCNTFPSCMNWTVKRWQSWYSTHIWIPHRNELYGPGY